ncbi:MAG TPA: ATP-binding protein, partial [Pyrinomonadaceae bacterium]
MEDIGDTNILVVNDNPDHLELMRMALRKVGYGVLTALDGGEAFETALRERVELIISDVMMPDVNGIELCRLVRGHPALKSLPILLVSALRKDTESVVEGLRSGADAFVESPFDLMHLIAVISRLVERKRGEDHILRLNEELEVRVRERTAQLESANLELEHEVAERRVIESDLEKARDEALVTARLKAEFLANVSHEIRTPMHAVLGMVGLLLKTPLRPKQAEFAEAIRESADSLLAIINDVLDLSKIEAGKMRVDKTDFDLSDIVDASVNMFLERVRAKGLSLGCMIDDGVPTLLRGDPGRLRQVLVNLLSNAVKFTESGAVTLEVTGGPEADGHVTLRFEVKDTGIGISREARQRIFLPFTQADGSDTRPYGGTGLGLAISRQLVELMGGEIGVESEAGRGSTFWFTVRCAQQPGAAPDAPRSDLEGLSLLVVGSDAAHRGVLLQQAGQWKMPAAEAEDAGRALGLLREAQ